MAKLLLIGASGLDWPDFSARLASGKLPHLARLHTQGSAGWLTSAAPGNLLAAWGSIATGQQVETHGVFRDQEAWGGGLRATSRASWRVAPVWARLAEAGKLTASVDWPATRNGADWKGLHFDDSFAEANGIDAWNWALPLRCCPEELRDVIRAHRVHPTQVTAEMLQPLVPGLGSLDQRRDARLPTLAVALARAATVQAAATWLLSQSKAEVLFIHQSWLGDVRGKFDTVKDGPFAGVMDGAWRFLDSLIGGMAAAAGPDVSVLLVSPGWHSRPGIFLAAGEGFTASPEAGGGSELDIVPTILGLRGLEDPALPGRRLPIASERAYAPAPAVPMPQPEPPDAALLQIAAENGGKPLPAVPPGWHARGLADLALLLQDRAPEIAADMSAAALRLDPDNVIALAVRAMTQVTLEKPDELPKLAEALDRVAPGRRWGALARGCYHLLKDEMEKAAPFLTEAESDRDAVTLLRVAAMWLVAERPMNAERVFKSILSRDPQDAAAEIGLSLTALARFDYRAAEAALQRARAIDPGRASIYVQLAVVYKQTGRVLEEKNAVAAARRLGAHIP